MNSTAAAETVQIATAGVRWAGLTRRTFAEQKSLQGAITVEWSDVGISTKSIYSRSRFAWADFIARREVLEAHARAWSQRLGSRPDLAEALVDFADNVLK